MATPRRGPGRNKAWPSTSPRVSRPNWGYSAAACRARIPARGSTTSGSASGASRRGAAALARTTTSRSPATATRPAPSPGSAGRSQAPCSPSPAPVACAPTSGAGTRRRCGAPTAPSPTWRRCFARSSPSPAAARLPPDPETGRGSPLYHRHCLPIGADHPQPSRRARRVAKLGRPQARPRGPAAGHRDLPANRTGAPCISGRPPAPSPIQRAIYQALDIDPAPGGIRKTVV